MRSEQYIALNASFGRPFRYDLTTARGFFSVVNCLINAATYGLITKRQLLVSESNFGGLSWSDFFDFKWPDEVNAEPLDLAIFNDFVRNKSKSLLPLRIPDAFGSVLTIQRSLAKYLTAPVTRPAMVDIPRPYAAVHVRRGDKTGGYEAGGKLIIESLPVLPTIYVAAVQRHLPEAKAIFVMSDDYRIVDEIRGLAEGIEVVSLGSPSEQGYQQSEFLTLEASSKKAVLDRLLSEVTIAASADIFVGGYESNVSRYIPLVHAKPNNCFSVDSRPKWRPI